MSRVDAIGRSRQQRLDVLIGAHRLAGDREDAVADLHADSRREQRRAGLEIEAVARIELGDAVGGNLSRHRLEVDAQEAHRHAGRAGEIAAADVGVAAVQLGDHLAQQEVQIAAVRDRRAGAPRTCGPPPPSPRRAWPGRRRSRARPARSRGRSASTRPPGRRSASRHRCRPVSSLLVVALVDLLQPSAFDPPREVLLRLDQQLLAVGRDLEVGQRVGQHLRLLLLHVERAELGAKRRRDRRRRCPSCVSRSRRPSTGSTRT